MKTTKILATGLFTLACPLLLDAQTPEGDTLFTANCANCHVELVDEKIPTLAVLNDMSANAILRTLTDGAMRIQGNLLTPEQRVAVAEYVSGETVIDQPISFSVGMCESIPALQAPAAGSVWSGWGNDEGNTRYQTETGGLTAAEVPKLTLKWAFGLPDVSQARAQPAVWGERLYVGSQAGVVFSLNALSGCAYWSFKSEGGIRTAMSLGDIVVDGVTRTAVFFNDLQAYAYALDAETGALLWQTKVEAHPAAMGTGALKYHKGRVYVPMSGLSEEAIANGSPDYRCCSFRGSVTALDANTGAQVWQTYALPEAQFVRNLDGGGELWGPAGAAIWNTPTVDVKRKLLYFATGNAYVEPPAPTSNAVIAVDLDTGRIVWVNQTLAADIWSGGCFAGLGGNPENPGCPQTVGPDFDFSASPVLTTLANGKDLIIATQKSGKGYAFDPDDGGRLLWTYDWGVGAAPGGVYGAATDGERAYFAVADFGTPAPGGLHAVNLATGQREWFTPPADLLCAAGPGCTPVQGAAVTAMPGVVFSGSADGGLRAYSSTTGAIIWTYDTNRSFETVNGVTANGGSMDGPGAVIANGMVYITSGNGGPFGRPGNVLLAFAVE